MGVLAKCGLSGLGASGHQDVQAASDSRLEEACSLTGQSAERDEVVEMVARTTNFRTLIDSVAVDLRRCTRNAF